MKKWMVPLGVVAVLATAATAWAGSSGAPPGAQGGGGGAEPELIALVLFSLIPGAFFARRAMARARIDS